MATASVQAIDELNRHHQVVNRIGQIQEQLATETPREASLRDEKAKLEAASLGRRANLLPDAGGRGRLRVIGQAAEPPAGVWRHIARVAEGIIHLKHSIQGVVSK